MQGADQKEQQHPSTTHVPLAHRPLVVPAGQPPNCKGLADPATIILVREKVGTSLCNVEINSIHHQSTGNGTWSSVQINKMADVCLHTSDSYGRRFFI